MEMEMKMTQEKALNTSSRLVEEMVTGVEVKHRWQIAHTSQVVEVRNRNRRLVILGLQRVTCSSALTEMGTHNNALKEQVTCNTLQRVTYSSALTACNILLIPGDMPGVPWKSLMFINDARPKGKFTICKFAGETDDCCLLTDLVNEDWLWKLNVHCGTTMMSLMTICSENVSFLLNCGRN
ncbi:hypothetical protein HAX54_042501 [Datura stramonium]|uniref:Uncharacterized protein n=1 Tax=Datura stramonium TaxID=4076 RepID=A0ABS8W4C9_DATST|nr:hypothetical protein [Datura stramonium]